jgi:hypothetical protein
MSVSQRTAQNVRERLLKTPVPAVRVVPDKPVEAAVKNHSRCWNSLYSPRFWGILQILIFSESTQIYGKTYSS